LKVLVTGINGFVGQHLKRELEIHGHDVRGLDVISANAKVFEADILDALRLNKALKDTGTDAVIHLAAIAMLITEILQHYTMFFMFSKSS
jgi:nucleoside-diphosphate-sugar epimerase